MNASPEIVSLRRAAVWMAAAFVVPNALYGLAHGAGPREILPLVVVLLGAWIARRAANGRAGPMGVLWPIVFWPAMYQGAVGVLQLGRDRYVDDLFVRLDAVVLGYVGPPRWQLGGPIEELSNVFYVSYYAVVPLALFWIWRRSEAAALRYGLALITAMAICSWGWLIAPAGGYHAVGYPVGHVPFGLFTRAAHLLYQNNPHFAAAFPSSHVAVAVALVVVLRSVGASRAWWFWAFGVAISTFYCQYHFVVDAPGGWVVGWLAGSMALAISEVPTFAPAAWARSFDRLRRRK